MTCSCLCVLCQAQYGPGPDPDAQEGQGRPDLQGRRVQLCGFDWAMLLSAKFREQATAPLQKWSVKLQEGWGRKQNSLGGEQWLVTAHSLCQ